MVSDFFLFSIQVGARRLEFFYFSDWWGVENFSGKHFLDLSLHHLEQCVRYELKSVSVLLHGHQTYLFCTSLFRYELKSVSVL